jgi:CBS domain-containing protein
MARTARDIMQEDVVSVSPDLPLLDAHQLFVADEIHGAPVVSDDGEVVGVISSADLLRAVADEHSSSGAEADYLRDLIEFSSPDWVSMPADFQDRLREVRVSDAMTTDLVTVRSDSSLGEVADALCDNRIHRVLVIDGTRLSGIISTFDLVGVLRDDEAAARRAS